MAWIKGGPSPNPGGRPRLMQGVRREAQSHADEALAVALKVMRESDKGSEQLAAAVKVLQLAGVSFSAEATPGAEQAPQPVPSADMSDEDLLDAAAAGEG